MVTNYLTKGRSDQYMVREGKRNNKRSRGIIFGRKRVDKRRGRDGIMIGKKKS